MASKAEIKAMENSSDARKKILADIENKIAEIEKQIQGDGKFGVFCRIFYIVVYRIDGHFFVLLD